MALAFVFSRATIWSSECRTSSRLPRASSTTQTMSTLATLTAALRQKFCQALLKAKSMRFQSRCMVPSCIFVSDDLAALDGHRPPPHHVDDLPVVGCHQNGRAARVDLQQQLNDLPGGRWIEVASRLVRQENPRVVHESARNRDPLLLPTGELVRILVLLPLEAYDAEDLLDLGLEVAQGALGDAQGKAHVLKDREVGEQLEVLEDHPNLPAQVRKMAALETAEVLPLDADGAGGRFLLADQ